MMDIEEIVARAIKERMLRSPLWTPHSLALAVIAAYEAAKAAAQDAEDERMYTEFHK